MSDQQGLDAEREAQVWKQNASRATLSKRALKLLNRIEKKYYYYPNTGKQPKAMEELINAGLVVTTSRVMVVQSCHVPANGYIPYQPEQFVRS